MGVEGDRLKARRRHFAAFKGVALRGAEMKLHLERGKRLK
jgi:hypothetical protein